MKKRPLLEKDIEAYLCKKTLQDGRQHYKFTSPSRRAVPDQLVLGHRNGVVAETLLKLRASGVIKTEVTDKVLATLACLLGDAIMAEAITFVECKRPGAKPTPSQEREHARLRARGFRVLVIDTKEGVDAIYGSDLV